MDVFDGTGCNEINTYEMRCCKFLLTRFDEAGQVSKRLEMEGRDRFKHAARTLVEAYPLALQAVPIGAACVLTGAALIDSVIGSTATKDERQKIKAAVSDLLAVRDHKRFVARLCEAYEDLYEFVPTIVDERRKVDKLFRVRELISTVTHEMEQLLLHEVWSDDHARLLYVWRNAVCTCMVATATLVDVGEVQPDALQDFSRRRHSALEAFLPKFMVLRSHKVLFDPAGYDVPADAESGHLVPMAFRLRDSFTGRVSPEFRIGASEILERRAREKIQEYLGIVERNALYLQVSLPP